MAERVPQARSLGPQRLKKRREFLHVAGGRKGHAAMFTVQARPQPEAAHGTRVGLTVTRKVGNAVERNRIKRRLREVLRLDGVLGLAPTHDYVIVARRPLLTTPFRAIGDSLRITIQKIHAAPRGKSRAPQP